MLVTDSSLQYLLSLPDSTPGPDARPLLCFLHGYDEGAPTPIQKALTRHGPFAPSAATRAKAEFILVAPQLPARGDLWYLHTEAVLDIIQQIRSEHPVDSQQIYLTGFSFGANGVFDLGFQVPDFWAALWAVDPTRVPQEDPGRPLWLSSGQVSRHSAKAFMQRLRLETLHNSTEPGDRVYEDQGQNHVNTARLAYQDASIYQWLLSKRLISSE